MMKRTRILVATLIVSVGSLVTDSLRAADFESVGERMLHAYFRAESMEIERLGLGTARNAEEWMAQRDAMRRELSEMLGLLPVPPRGDLHATVTRTTEKDGVRAENIHFQSLPGLYVTANFYRPVEATQPLPVILLLCGHGPSKINDVNYGNKVTYQHHGTWFARNGFACLVLDSLAMGEIEGLHGGTFQLGRWWWNMRGYTPLGVEVWNAIRAIDYLETRQDIQKDRMGVTGRDGGASYTWVVSALDDRVKATVAVAGITDIRNLVADACVDNLCDCMFFLNTFRWDMPRVVALSAPRPVLLGNTDQDRVFPLDGVTWTHAKARPVYEWMGATTNYGLSVAPGPHRDMQELQVPTLRWMNRFLKGEDPAVTTVPEKIFQPDELKVFSQIPEDQTNTRIDETFVPAAPPPIVPRDAATWYRDRDRWLETLRSKVFGGWPTRIPPLQIEQIAQSKRQGVTFTVYEFDSQPNVRLRLYAIRPSGLFVSKRCNLRTLDVGEWANWIAVMRAGFSDVLAEEAAAQPLPDTPRMAEWEQWIKTIIASKETMYFFAPRGIGWSAWTEDPREEIHIRRRFMLLGQTLDGMRVWDILRAGQAIRTVTGNNETPVVGIAKGNMAVHQLYAAVFDERLAGVELYNLPTTHYDGPDYLNILRYMDIPQAVALAAEVVPVTLPNSVKEDWSYPMELGQTLKWKPGMLLIVPSPTQVKGLAPDLP